jgi:hypothetical protein
MGWNFAKLMITGPQTGLREISLSQAAHITVMGMVANASAQQARSELMPFLIDCFLVQVWSDTLPIPVLF